MYVQLQFAFQNIKVENCIRDCVPPNLPRNVEKNIAVHFYFTI